MQRKARRTFGRVFGGRGQAQGRRGAGSLMMSSSLGLVLASALPASAQDLTGTYVYQPPEGAVTLELRQIGTRLTGVLYGLDGTASQLDGAFENGRATGTIRMMNGSGWFAVAVYGDGVRLLAAGIDPDTGAPDLSDGWQLDFTRTNTTGAGTTSAAAGVAPPRAASATPAVTPLVQEWTQHLAGRKVTYMDSYGDGSGGGYSSHWEAYICSDGSFHYRSSNRMNADVGGVFGSSNSSNSFSGQWRIIEHSGQAVLQYQREHEVGTDQGQWVALGHQNGVTYFDGSRVFVTNDNTMCR